MYSGLTCVTVSNETLLRQRQAHLDPIFISPIEYILRVRVFDNKAFSLVSHDSLHVFVDFLRGTAFVFLREFDMPFYF